jgi:DNA mismatch endonuclease (patch repair protein)
VDKLTPEQRSRHMRGIRQRNTTPEVAVRKLLHSLGFRYRLNDRSLPGSPDIVFRKRRKVIFVHGCFWHGHYDCKLATLPKSRTQFWLDKFAANRERDARVADDLTQSGWNVLTVWQCQLRDISALEKCLRAFLES